MAYYTFSAQSWYKRFTIIILGMIFMLIVSACPNNSGASVSSSEGVDPNVLHAPTSVNVIRQSSSSIYITWNPVFVATSYKVYWSYTPSGTYNYAGETDYTNFTKDDLQASDTGYIKVKAINSTGESEFSSYSSFPAYTPVSETTTPGIPTSVAATAQSSNSIQISWIASSSGGTPTRYNIWRSSSAYGIYSEIGYISSSSTLYSDTGLSESTTYYYKVDAENNAGRSQQSSYVSATTNSSGNGSTPGTPSNVTATTQSSSSIQISWTASSYGGIPTWYNIWRSSSSNGTYTEIGYVSGSTTSYTNTGLNGSTTYYYKVDAENSAGRSQQSSYVSATTSSSGAGSIYGTWLYQGYTLIIINSSGSGSFGGQSGSWTVMSSTLVFTTYTSGTRVTTMNYIINNNDKLIISNASGDYALAFNAYNGWPLDRL